MSLERNLLIEAGAGTGKTTRLVKAVLQALFIRQIPLESVVALTFTNKAAGELKERVGSALDEVLAATSIDALRKRPWWPTPEPVLSLTDLQKLAQAASHVLDRADISTIHSFAFALLKRFPLASGIDPNASIDDKGLRFDELFRREWPLWLQVELGDNAPREKEWLELMEKLTLSEIREAAIRLADFDVPHTHLVVSGESMAAELKKLHAEIRSLCATHTNDKKADLVARACEEVIGRAGADVVPPPNSVAPPPNSVVPAPNFVVPAGRRPGPTDDRPRATDPRGDELKAELKAELKPELKAELKATLSQSLAVTKDWPESDLSRLKLFKAIALNLLAGGDRLITLLTTLLSPFILRFRDVLLAEGCLTHSALLFLSREMVRHHPEIRTQLKRRIQFILIDEFQDTDPLQAELLLFLTERAGEHSLTWEGVKLEAGKLFIVGDPKQSIYRFRGADIAAYERIGKLVVEQGGSQETLETNYRSQSQIIHLVNQAFEGIIQAVPGISPPYIAVKPHHLRDTKEAVQNVEVWLAGSAEKQSTEDAQTTEAEHIARWIADAKGKMTIHDPKENARRPLLYRDVALIFRTYSPMDRFIEALRRHDIPFAVESERYFFTTPEVTDFINLLRAADNPDDLLSLVGYLRSPLAGLTDQEILKLKLSGYLMSSRAAPSHSSSPAATGGGSISPQAKSSLDFIASIGVRLRREPLPDVLHHIFADTFVMELAARSYHGDQTVANLLKFKRLIEGFAAEGITTMGLLLKKLDEFFNDDKIEGESPLADENYNAVRLLTIHKAKGLEYPVVFLPSLHSELRAHKPEPFVYDWRTQKLGLNISGHSNLDKLLLDESTRRREAAEENRILYVAMTRARERLVLSGGLNLKVTKKNTFLHRLLGSWGMTLEGLEAGPIQLRDAELTVRTLDPITITESAPVEAENEALNRVDVAAFAKLWKAREERRVKVEETLLIATPTMKTSSFPAAAGGEPIDDDVDSRGTRTPLSSSPTVTQKTSSPTVTGGGPINAAMLGTLVHRFLESWDFIACEKCEMPAKLRHVANAYFAQEGLLRQPFPDPKEGELELKPDDPMYELAQVVDAAQKLLADFIGSAAWEEIKSSEILGREVPFFYGTAPMMRGTMDIIYRRKDGTIVIGDYKTGQTKQDYAAQSAAYREAVICAIGEQSTFKIIALRSEDAVPQ